MGEVQGSIWTTTLFITLFVGMVSMLFRAVDVMQYNSEVFAIEDNIKAGNYDYFNTLTESFRPCGVAYDTYTNCSGIIEVNTEQRYVKYQVSFDGLIRDVDASGDNDHLVLLPY